MSIRRGFDVWRAHRSALGFRALALAAGLLACGGAGSDSTGPGGGGGGGSGGAASVVITPSAPAVNVGAQVSLTAQVLDASGGAIGGATIFWSSADTTIATVSSIGVVTGKAVGSTQIAASSGGKSAAVVLTVTPIPVASIAVLPSAVTLVINGNVTLASVASDANGNTLTGRAVTWASSAPSVATVDGTGNVTGVTAGTVTISATCEGKTASSTVTVTLIPVASVSIAPSSAALNVGQSTSLTAVTTDSHGNVLSGRPITWSTSNSGIATVSNAGLVSAISAGTAAITATAEGKSGGAQVVVTSITPPPPIPVASVSVAPGTASLNPGGTVTLSATVRDINGAALTGRVVTWSSSATSVATVSSSGVVTAVAPGSAAITATCETKSSPASTVTVVLPTDPVDTVIVTPVSATIVQDSSTSVTATLRDHAGNVLTGRAITWASSVPAVASVAPVGPSALVSAADLGVGNTAITATSEGKTGAAVVTVIPRPVATVAVSPSSVTVIAGATTALVDTTRDGHNRLLTGRTVTWSTSNSTIATVSTTGLVTTLVPGVDTITATSEGQSGISVVTVIPVPVATVTLSPTAASIAANDSTSLVATLKDGNGNVLTGRVVTWTSGTPSAASVHSAVPTSGTAEVDGVAPGSSLITATSEGKTGTSTITVTQVPVAFVQVSPGTDTLVVGRTLPMTATAQDASHHTLSGRTVAWSSSNPSVATVDAASGLVTAVDSGSVTITATVETIVGSANITVTPVGSITLTPSSTSIVDANPITITAQALDGNNNPVAGRAYSWTSSDPTIATVTATGSTVSVSPSTPGNNGPVTITVTCDGVTNTVTITVSGQ